MNRILKKLLAGISVFGLLVSALPLSAAPAYASTADTFADTYNGNIISGYDTDDTDGQGIFLILNIILTVLTFGIAAAGIVGLVIAGIMYMTSRGDAGQMAKAKTRIIEIIIGLVAYALLWTVLNWLIPGGIGGIF